MRCIATISAMEFSSAESVKAFRKGVDVSLAKDATNSAVLGVQPASVNLLGASVKVNSFEV
jgi:hypothetical protein